MAHLRKYPNGSWQAVVRSKGLRPQSHTFPSRAQATTWARSVEAELDQGIFFDRKAAATTTLADLIARYSREVTPRKKGAQQEARRLAQLTRALGHLTVERLDAKQFAAYRNNRLAEGLSGATVNRELAAFSHVIEVARRKWGVCLAANPIRLVTKAKEASGRTRRLAREEEERLLGACAPSPRRSGWIQDLEI
jgi:hypothetical protein